MHLNYDELRHELQHATTRNSETIMLFLLLNFLNCMSNQLSICLHFLKLILSIFIYLLFFLIIFVFDKMGPCALLLIMETTWCCRRPHRKLSCGGTAVRGSRSRSTWPVLRFYRKSYQPLWQTVNPAPLFLVLCSSEHRKSLFLIYLWGAGYKLRSFLNYANYHQTWGRDFHRFPNQS